MFPNNVYDVLKWIAMPVLPAITTFLAALAEILKVPELNLAAAIVAAFDTCLCSILQISTANYNKKLELDNSTAVVKEDESNEDSEDAAEQE